MSNPTTSSNWFYRLADNGIGLLVLAALLLGLFVAGAWYLDIRLTAMDAQTGHEPPRSFQEPVLSDFNPGDTRTDDLINQHLVYVPVYSHTYFDGGRPFSLETTLSIRNVSVSNPIYLDSVKYYDTNGNLASTQLDQLIKLAPLQTIEFLVKRRDSTGGSGANFLVRWLSDSDVDEPIVEALMVGIAGTQGISFRRQGVEISPE